MKATDLPILASVLESGAEDPVFDALLLSGPIVIGLIVLLGRGQLSTAIALGYIGLFIVHILHRGTSGRLS